MWTLDHWREAFDEVTFTEAFRNMIVLGLGTAASAVLVYVFVAYCAIRLKSAWQAAFDILSWLPITIPGIILGFGYLFMVIQVPIFAPLYGTIWVMILVSFLSSMTLGVQVIKVHMLQLGAEIEEAARTAGASWLATFRRVILPLTSPAVAVVGVLVFASTIRQIGSLILLSTGETRVARDPPARFPDRRKARARGGDRRDHRGDQHSRRGDRAHHQRPLRRPRRPELTLRLNGRHCASLRSSPTSFTVSCTAACWSSRCGWTYFAPFIGIESGWAIEGRSWRRES